MEERLREELEKLFQGELGDDRLMDVRVARATCSGDLRHAKIGLEVPGERHERRQALEAARGASGAIRALIGERLSGRFVPDLTFHIDEAGDVLRLLDQISDEPALPPSSDAPPAEAEQA